MSGLSAVLITTAELFASAQAKTSLLTGKGDTDLTDDAFAEASPRERASPADSNQGRLSSFRLWNLGGTCSFRTLASGLLGRHWSRWCSHRWLASRLPSWCRSRHSSSNRLALRLLSGQWARRRCLRFLALCPFRRHQPSTLRWNKWWGKSLLAIQVQQKQHQLAPLLERAIWSSSFSWGSVGTLRQG